MLTRRNPSAQYKAIRRVEYTAGVPFGVAASAYSRNGGDVAKAIKSARNLKAENPAKFDRCVRDVKRKGGAKSAYAVCTAAGTRNPGAGPLVSAAFAHSAAGRKATEALQKIFSKRQNPKAESEQMFELFHGMPPDEIIKIVESVHVHSKVWTAGTLTSMIVVNQNTGKEAALIAPDPDQAKPEDVVYVTLNEDMYEDGEVKLEAGTQMYFRGGDQSLPTDFLKKRLGLKDDDFRECMEIGYVVELTYRTRKSFEKNGEELIDFYHELGKQHSRGVYPLLVYTPRDQKMAMYGGRYKVLPYRYDIGASPGIGG